MMAPLPTMPDGEDRQAPHEKIERLERAWTLVIKPRPDHIAAFGFKPWIEGGFGPINDLPAAPRRDASRSITDSSVAYLLDLLGQI
jgi:hypothetical protein